jgi:hypothetical protein
MACSKYTLTNTGSTVVNFSYRRCEDSMWDYQVELAPNQLKNIWVINGTYTVAPSFKNTISFVNNGPFPPISATNTPTPSNSPTPTPSLTPSNTPTQTPTPSVTATQTPTVTPTGTAGVTPTPSVTATNTPTPTEPIRYEHDGICHSESNGDSVCSCTQTATVWTDQSTLALSSVMFSDPNGPNTGNPEGWYAEDGIIYEVATNCGPGCTTGATISVYGVCGVTPTPTPTNTETPTPTPTNTPTSTGTPTPTPTNSYFSFSITSGSTSNQACEAGTSGTIWGNNPQFDLSDNFYVDGLGNVGLSAGYYANLGKVAQLDSNGAVVGSIIFCSNVVTPTPTVTQTPSPTPTFGYYTYSLGTGSTANLACSDYLSAPNTIYGTVAGGVGPNIGEFLYTSPGNPPTNPVVNGFYSNGTAVFQVTGGLGEITSVDPSGC